MNHAKIDELYEINTLIESIRRIKNIMEKNPGHFYYKSRNVIHFHVNNSIIYADVGDIRIMVKKDEGCYKTIIDNINEYIEKIDNIPEKK